MSYFRKLWFFRTIEKVLNRFRLREKIIGLFIFCVIVPLILTDGIILWRIASIEKAESIKTAENMAESVANTFYDLVSSCEKMANSVGQNDNIGEVLGIKYAAPYDYYDRYYSMTRNYYFQTLVGYENTKVKIYSSNDSLISGGYIGRIDSVEDTDWYKAFKESGKNSMLICCYDPSKQYHETKRNIYFIEKLSYPNNKYENFIRIDIDYNTFSRKLVAMGHSRDIYVLDGDKILLTNKGMNNHNEIFETFDEQKDVIYSRNIEMAGNISSIVVLKDEFNTFEYVRKNIGIIFALILINIFLPALVMYVLDYSIIHRIQKLDQVFGKRENDVLVKIENPDGTDEISNLMVNYNKMADQINRLIQIVYKDRLHEQEVNLARKNAELLALQSQINPHFMFNALESIRMHSVIKGENETAEMVERLAVMERQYVDWGSDLIEVRKEMSSVEAYLGLQKYRFGDKLMYELSIEDDCASLKVPKLTIVTFVENACVHGMENKKSECWVFVRVYRKNENIIIEVEDTGNGIGEEVLISIREKAETIEIDDMKAMNHVGIFNALLRLKMTMGEGYKFEIESEEGIGTMIQITIPASVPSQSEEDIV